MKKNKVGWVLNLGKNVWEKHSEKIIEGVGVILDKVQKNNFTSSKKLMPKSKRVDEKGGKLIVIDVVDSDDAYFEETLSKLQDAVNKGVGSPNEAVEALKVLADSCLETIKYCEEQKTKRIEILAKRDAVVAQINSITSMINEYLDKTFDERSKQFAMQFEFLDASLKNGNTEIMMTTLNDINTLAAESPFKTLGDVAQVKKSLKQGTEWDI